MNKYNFVGIGSILWTFAELEMMKERFAKLLLGEDMSGGGKGVCTAVTISNAITNLYGNFFKKQYHSLVKWLSFDF